MLARPGPLCYACPGGGAGEKRDGGGGGGEGRAGMGVGEGKGGSLERGVYVGAVVVMVTDDVDVT